MAELESLPLALVGCDAAGIIRSCSVEAVRLLGRSEEALVGCSIGDLVGDLDRPTLVRLSAAALARQPTDPELLRRDEGSGEGALWLEWRAVAVERSGRPAVLFVLREVTEDLRAGEAARSAIRRQASLARALAELLQNPDLATALPVALGEIGTGLDVDRVYACELAAAAEAGRHYSFLRHEWRRRAVETTSLDGAAPIEFESTGLGAWWQEFEQGQPIERHAGRFPPEEAPYLESRGIGSLLVVPIPTMGPPSGAIGIIHRNRSREWSADERAVLIQFAAAVGAALRRERILRLLQASEGRFRQLVEHLPCGVAILDEERECRLVSPRLALLLGMEPGGPERGLLSSSHWQVVDEVDRPMSFLDELVDPVLRDGKTIENRLIGVNRPPAGGRVWLLVTSTPGYDDDGRVDQAVVLLLDVTDRRENEARVEASLKEKEVLLHEVFHRVKNNLQIVQSFLRLNSRLVTCPEAREVLDDACQRVAAMGRVHEQLARGHRVAEVEFGGFVRSLGRSLRQWGQGRDFILDFDVRGAAPILGFELAVSLGLILNELVTNAIKHAFGGRTHGRVVVDLAVEGASLTLTLTDNGVGWPGAAAALESGGSGLGIVQMLISQVRGRLDVANLGEGTCWRIVVPEAVGAVAGPVKTPSARP